MATEPIEYKKERDEWKRHSTENVNIKAAAKDFEAIGIGDEMIEYAVGFPWNWSQ